MTGEVLSGTPQGRPHGDVRLLVFCRGAVLDRFRAIFAPMEASFEVAYLTDIRASGVQSLTDSFYRNLDEGGPCPILTPEDLTEVVGRCRMLRRIERDQAEALTHAMANAIAGKLRSLAPDCISSQMVDEYVSHLVCLIARKLGIPYFGFCAGYFPGTSLLLADESGRPLAWREASIEEASKAYEAVAPATFRQNYNLPEAYGVARHLKSIARYGVKRVVFAAKRRIERDYWNVHYAQTPFIAERRHLRDYPGRGLFSADWRSDLADMQARAPGKSVLYLPLSYFPEATVDYWVDNKRAIQYEDFILDAIARLSDHYHIVVKEHLHMMGARPRAFLAALRKLGGVVSVYPLEMSNHVVDRADAILMGSGSPGVEASLRGKPVLTFCRTSYWFAPSGATFLDIADLEIWPSAIERAIAARRPIDEDARLRFVRDCLKASTRVLAGTDPWPALDPVDVDQLVRWLIASQAKAA